MTLPKTEKLYYKDPYLKEFDASVLSSFEENGSFKVILDRTAFYPEGGGQPADHGRLGSLFVTDVHEKEGIIIHSCTGTACPPEGVTVHCALDWERRFDHMQQHSGEHIVSGMLCSEFHCSNVGFHMGEDFVTIDYDTLITEEDLKLIEEKANRYLWENHPFEELWPTPEELKTLEYRSKKELTGDVRITRFPGADCCACCGTHVGRSGEVGIVKFFSVQKFREGVRIEMMSGNRALRYLSACYSQNILCSQLTSSKPLETGAAVAQMKEEVIRQKGRILTLEDRLTDCIAETFSGKESPVFFAEDLSGDSLRKLCVKIAARATGRILVFSGCDSRYNYVCIEEGADLRPFITDMNSALSGRGGGRDGFAQGSVSAERKQIENYLAECRF